MFLTVITLTVLSGCSVRIALPGKQDPNLGAIRVGATRGEIELHLGYPITTTTLEDRKRQDTYEYELGNEASAGQAIGHGVMDVTHSWTLGSCRYAHKKQRKDIKDKSLLRTTKKITFSQS